LKAYLRPPQIILVAILLVERDIISRDMVCELVRCSSPLKKLNSVFDDTENIDNEIRWKHTVDNCQTCLQYSAFGSGLMQLE
jgi:hypothetical protein